MDSKYSEDQPEYATSYTPSWGTDDQDSSQHYMSSTPGEVQDYMYDGSDSSSSSESEQQ